MVTTKTNTMLKKIMKRTMLASLLAVLAIPMLPAFAAGASITLSSNQSTVAIGGSVVVAVYMNGGGSPVNAVQTDVSYSSSKLQYVGFSSTGSAFEISAANGGSDGLASVARATTTPVSGSALVGTMTFRALAGSGSTSIDVASSSSLVNANDNTSLAYGTSGVSVGFGAAASASSSASATSHAPAAVATPAAPKDTTPPVITAIKPTDTTPFSTAISWTTDEASDSVVEYGLDANYGLSASWTPTQTKHYVLLSSAFLTPQTLIHYRVKSTDAAGNVATSPDKTLQLPGVTVAIVVRGSDGKPQAGATVTIDGASGTTDSKGEVTLPSTLGTKKVTTTYQGVTVQKTITVAKSVKPLPPYQLDLSRQPLNRWMFTSAGLVVVVLTLLGIDAVLFGSRLFRRVTRLQVAKEPATTPAPKAFHLPSLNHRLPKREPLRAPLTVATHEPVAEAVKPEPAPISDIRPEAPKPKIERDPMEAVTELMGGPPPETNDLSPNRQSQPVQLDKAKTKPAVTIGHFADHPASAPLVIDIKPLVSEEEAVSAPSVRQTAPPLPVAQNSVTTIQVTEQDKKTASVASRLKKPAAKKHVAKSKKSTKS